jgi:hypothetical protein
MHENIARYQYVYGLKPIGPHRRDADRIMGALRATCPTCEGGGILWPEDGRAWRVCLACEGTGGFWTCSPEREEAARRWVRSLHPDAGVTRRDIRFLWGQLAQYSASGEW